MPAGTSHLAAHRATNARGARRPGAAAALVLAAALALGGCQQSHPADTAATTTPTVAAEPSPTATTEPAPATTAQPSSSATAEPSEPAASTESAATATTEPTATPTATTDPTDGAVEAAPEATATKKPSDDYLRPGSTGARVTALQQSLVDLGYWGTSVDGDFGAGTTQAVWALQKAAGLARDGVVGPSTLAALKDGVRPTAHTSSGHVIEIDVPRQLVLLVDDGKVMKIMNASSGSGEQFEAKGNTYTATTRAGSFVTGRQVDGVYASGLELGDMYRPKFFNGGIAVHGSPSVPPWPASHGCVRVTNSSMNYIWDTWSAPPGTAVLVY